MILASSLALALGVAVVRTGRGPLALLILALLHLRAALKCTWVALRYAGRIWRERYWEVYAGVRAEAGR